MKFKSSLVLAFLATAALLMANAYGLSWLDQPFVSQNTVKSESDSFSELQDRTFIDKSRTSSSISTLVNLNRTNSVFSDLLGPNMCIEAFWESQDTMNTIPFVSIRSDQELIPASVTKYVTAAVVYNNFEASDTLDTNLIASSNSSNIDTAYIEPSGDPSFVSVVGPVQRRPDYLSPSSARTFTDFANNVFASGVRNISNLVIDNKWFELPSVEEGWRADRAFVGQLAALNLDEGFEAGVLAANPDDYSAALLKSVLEQRGITVGDVSFGEIPQDLSDDSNIIASTKSAPIEQLVLDMLSTSNNVYAEQLLAAAVNKSEGSVNKESRTNFVEQEITEILRSFDGLKFVNGSGYTREARMSCEFVNNLIEAMEAKGVDLPGLSAIAGERGTLSERLGNIPETVSAKTGTLNNATALSGRVGENIIFSFIGNGNFSESGGFELQESVTASFASFPFINDLSL